MGSRACIGRRALNRNFIQGKIYGCLRCGIVSVCEFGAKLLSSYIHCQTFKARAAWDSWPTDKARLDSLV